jgi:hypothetical protein
MISSRCDDNSRQIRRAGPLSEIRKQLKMEIEALEVVRGTLLRLNAVKLQRGSQRCLGKSPS